MNILQAHSACKSLIIKDLATKYPTCGGGVSGKMKNQTGFRFFQDQQDSKGAGCHHE
jgi:hypothetical protein